METNQKDRKKFSLFLAIILGLNAVVGSGIFTMPLVLVKMAGPAGILTIILSMISVLFIGIALARITSLLPQEGGFYRYVSAWAGKKTGLFAATMYLTGMIVAISLMVKIVSSVIGVYMTGVSTDYISYFIIIGTIIATFFASSMAAVGQTILFILTILPLFLIIYLCLKQGTMDHFYPYMTHGFQGVLRGMPTVLFSFMGFESISSLTRVIKNPGKTIPLATLWTIIIAGTLYIAFVGSVIMGVPGEILSTKNVFPEALLYAMPHSTWLVNCINFAIIVTILGTIYAVMWSLSELLRSVVSKASDEKHSISETLGLLLIGFSVLISMKIFTNIPKAFSAVAICSSLTWALSSTYLLAKPLRIWDKVIGVLALLSCIIIFISAFAQLI